MMEHNILDIILDITTLNQTDKIIMNRHLYSATSYKRVKHSKSFSIKKWIL